MPRSTSAASASCDTHFGDTKLVASTEGKPAALRRSISSILTAVGTYAVPDTLVSNQGMTAFSKKLKQQCKSCIARQSS